MTSAAYNGVGFFGLNFGDGSVLAGFHLITNLSGLTATDVSFTPNSIQFNLQGRSFAKGYFVELDLITTPASGSCSYSLSPAGASFAASAAVSSFTVATASGCAWSAVASASWIAVLPSASNGTGKVNFAVLANNSGARSGQIAVGGQDFTIDQQGFSCSYTVAPATTAVSDVGGLVAVSVSTPVGCPWAAVSNAPWLTVKSGASGSGGGVVVINIASNFGGPRTGTATIAGQTFKVTQGAGACGALDVTSVVGVRTSGFTQVPFSTLESQSISVSNNSGAVLHGPVYLALVGEPTHIGYPNDTYLLGSQLETSCFSTQGDYLIPVSFSDMTAGQTVGIPLLWIKQGPFGLVRYSSVVLSGKPSK